MINWRIIARIFSLLLILEGFFMLLTAAVAFIYGEETSDFLYSALITAVSGILAFTPLKNEEKVTGKKEGYILITGGWVLFSLFSTLPYLFTGAAESFTDAFFESISGFTTTGATIFNEVESLPRGLLFWRSLTQWIGGMGIIFISMYVLPVFRSINIQLPAGEFTGQPADKIHPRIKDVAKRLISIYAIVTFAEAIFLIAGGVPSFDAICTSFSTLSTGGFTTTDNGIGSFANDYVLAVITLFMFIGGLNMTFIYLGLKGNVKKTFNNEFFFYTIICVVFAVLVSSLLMFNSGMPARQSLLEGSFHVISVITTTGFYIRDPLIWGEIIIVIFFLLMFTGGTSGSTSGGLKIVRLLLVTKNSKQELIRLLHPNAYIPVRLDERVVSQTTIFNLLVFISLYIAIICGSSIVLSFMDYDLISSFSTSASLLANLRPGIGEFGPSTSFAEIPVFGKWFLSGLMLVGRLELLTVMIIFTRSFYHR